MVFDGFSEFGQVYAATFAREVAPIITRFLPQLALSLFLENLLLMNQSSILPILNAMLLTKETNTM